MRTGKWVLLVLAFAVLPAAQGVAGQRWVLPLEDRSWRTVSVPGTLENTYTISGGLITVQSDNSASFRYLELPTKIGTPAQVNWRWRVENHSSLSRQDVKGRDDRPLAVHLWFDDTGDGSLFGAVGSILGYPKVGHLLTYVWGAAETTGSIVRNPYYRKGRVIVLVGPDAPTGEWRSVRRDVAQDFKAAFGIAPDLSTLRYIAISADTDDLGGRSMAALKSLSIDTP